MGGGWRGLSSCKTLWHANVLRARRGMRSPRPVRTYARDSQQVLYLATLIASVFPAAPNLHPLLSLHRFRTLAWPPSPPPPSPTYKKKQSSSITSSAPLYLSLLCRKAFLFHFPPPLTLPTYSSVFLPTTSAPPPPLTHPRPAPATPPHPLPPLSRCQSLGALGCSLVINLHPLSAVALLGHAKQAGKQACAHTHSQTHTHIDTHTQVMTIQSRCQMPTFTYK